MFKIFKDLFFGPNRTVKMCIDQIQLTRSYEHNIQIFKEIFKNDETLIFRELETQDNLRCMLIFVEGMIDKEIIHQNIITPIMTNYVKQYGNKTQYVKIFIKNILLAEEVESTSNLDQILTAVLYGDTLLLIEGANEGIIISSKGWQTRAVAEPYSESVVRGPREGFTESISINTTLIRRKIKDAKLKFCFREVGFRTRTKICITYIEGLASEEILDELYHRLNEIKIDGVLESGYIEEFIKDSPLTPFKTVGFTERPDIVAAKLLEGRVAILCDGTPFALTIPFLFIENFQANEDYYKNFFISSISRFFRYISFILATSIPAIYLAIVTYHQEMIPTPLLLSIAGSRQGVPFPTIVEAIALGFVFELLREGGVRLPKPIGQAISIVGAIVLGDAAVTAKIVSAPMIIITALTGIASFLIPQMSGLVMVFRLILLLLASFFGLYGVMFGIIGFFIQVMSMRSFGIPYMLHWGTITPQDLKDTVVRAPWWFMHLRPKLLGKLNPERQPDMFEPERGEENEKG